MSRFVNSLKRLYQKGRVTDAKLKEMLANGEITQEEYDYIVGEN